MILNLHIQNTMHDRWVAVLFEVPERIRTTYPVPEGKYDDSPGSSEGTFDNNCIGIQNGHGEAPQALHTCCCDEVAAQTNKNKFIYRRANKQIKIPYSNL